MNTKTLLTALTAAGLLAATSADAALILTDHPQGATPSEFYDSLTVATGSGANTGNRTSIDTGDVEEQSFTLDSAITVHSIYVGYNDQQSTGDFTFAIDVDHDGTDDHIFSGIAVADGTLQSGGTNGGPIHFMQFDISSENIALSAGQHSFSITGGTDNGEGDYLFATVWGGNVYDGGVKDGNAGRDLAFAVTAVPEPGSLALLGLGGLLIGARRRRDA